MSEKKRIKWKLNLFDIGLIVVVVLAAAAVLVLKMNANTAAADPVTGTPAGKITVNYVVELEQLHRQTAEMIKVGDQLHERTRKEAMGTVTSVTVEPARTLTKNELEGTFQFAEVPERYNVILEVTALATESDSNIVLESGLEIRAGTSVRVFGPDYYGAGYVLSLEKG